MTRKNRKEEKSETQHGTPGGDPQTPVNEINPQQQAGGNGSEPVPGATEPTAAYAELNDRYLRLYSDFDNFRKRTLKEKAEMSRYATEGIIVKLLPVLDDFDRALKAADVSTDSGQAMKAGIELIFNKFHSILQQQGLTLMHTSGETFDTDFHEAVTNIPAPSPEMKGKILDELEKGYLLHDKVIRYAKVVVGS